MEALIGVASDAPRRRALVGPARLRRLSAGLLSCGAGPRVDQARQRHSALQPHLRARNRVLVGKGTGSQSPSGPCGRPSEALACRSGDVAVQQKCCVRLRLQLRAGGSGRPWPSGSALDMLIAGLARVLGGAACGQAGSRRGLPSSWNTAAGRASGRRPIATLVRAARRQHNQAHGGRSEAPFRRGVIPRAATRVRDHRWSRRARKGDSIVVRANIGPSTSPAHHPPHAFPLPA